MCERCNSGYIYILFFLLHVVLHGDSHLKPNRAKCPLISFHCDKRHFFWTTGSVGVKGVGLKCERNCPLRAHPVNLAAIPKDAARAIISMLRAPTTASPYLKRGETAQRVPYPSKGNARENDVFSHFFKARARARSDERKCEAPRRASKCHPCAAKGVASFLVPTGKRRTVSGARRSWCA